MAAIIWADVVAHAAQLSTLSATAQADVLAFVDEVVDVSLLGGEASYRARMARIYLAAHLGEIERRRGKAGPVTSESAGGLARSYGASMTGDILDTTSYGGQFKSIARNSRARGPRVL